MVHSISMVIIWYSVSISGLFLFLLPFRLWQLSHSSIKILPSHPGRIKGLFSLIYLAIQLYSLVLIACRPQDHVISSFFCGVGSVVASLGVCVLSFLAHRRSVRPSSLLILYLLASLARSVILATAPGHHSGSTENQILAHVRILVEVAFLLLESRDKGSILRDAYKRLSLEETAGILGRTFFWWINPILKEGNRKILVADDLPITDSELSSEELREKIIRAWNKRVKPEGKSTLPTVLLRCLKLPFISAILPRLSLIIFRYSQAFLISLTIRFVNQNETITGEINSGYWLVFAATVIYVGMAFSTAIYQHKLNRLKVMIRGALVGLIYHRSLNIQSCFHEGGNAVTLMSTDVGNLETVGEMVHETWAQLLEVIVGTGILASQIGWLFPVPFVIILFCSQVSRYVATHLKSKQKNWSVATQDRVSMTASMLSSVKSMKMLGMTEAMNSKIQGLRDHEIEMSKKLRWMMVAYNASANLLGIFAPVVTLTLYAIISKYKGDGEFDADIVFTSTALLLMVTHPANMIMTIVPRAVASLANFERVQNYLLESSRQDARVEIEKTRTGSTPAVLVDKMTVQYTPASLPVLRDISFKIHAGAITMCSGPDGCGKTTLAKAILGEVPPSTGSISVSTKRIGFCAQAPWLPSGSIREAICGSSSTLDCDELWYETVITVCDLRTDLETLPEKDGTQIGSRGINLSGGQRQRVALARALYARCDILVLDDPFSALDGKTETNIVQNLLGPQGLFKNMGTAVFMITHAAQYFPLADHVLLLGDSIIQTQGTWEELKDVPSQITKIIMREVEKEQNVPDVQERLKGQGQIRIFDDAAEDLTRKTGDFSVYGYYFKSVGAGNILLLVCATASNTVCLTFSQYWLKWWTEANSEQMWFYIGGYLLLTFIAWLGTCGVPWAAYIRIAPKSGFVLHKKLLNAIIGAPLSYYSENDIGVMLNRFGQDIQLIDTQLPASVGIIMTQTFKLLMQATLLLCVQITLGVTLPFCIIIVYLVQRVYLRTSRQLRFIELESRSAVFSSFLETVEGVTTIRAFGWQSKFEAANVEELDKSQQPLYILFCLQRWLNIVFDLVIAGIAVGIIGLSVSLRGTTSGASVGVALNLILVANTTLLRLVESWTSLEISLGAIARLKSTVEHTPSEHKLWENLSPAENWPSSGGIEVENVTVSYNPSAIALKNISLTIAAGQKLIICGRTGSGKSTFILTLLHLMDLQSGTIKIDGIDLSSVPRSTLRQRCFISVPQDPFIFSNASLRFNLDPYGSLPDESLVKALEKTQLWQHLSGSGTTSSETLLGLPMTSIPPLSTGQLQLLSLSRAILRRESSSLLATYSDNPPTVENKPILLLDEATSSLDPDTEAIIHDIIQEEFTEKGYTVIIVAHRVSAFAKGMRRGIDAVLQMKDGRIERIGDVEDIVDLGTETEEIRSGS